MSAIQIGVFWSRGSSPLALSFVARGACLLLAVGLHGVAFAVASHGPSLVRSTESSRPNDPVVEVVAALDLGVPEAPSPPRDERASAQRLAPERAVMPPRATLPDAARPESSSLRDVRAPRPGAMLAGRASDDVVASPSGAPRFVMALSNDRPTLAIAPRATSDPGAAGVEPGSDAAPLAEEAVSSPARLLGTVSPTYPEGARAQEVEADIVVAIVVTKAGTVSDARVVKRAGMGLDEAVLAAVRAARFAPARQQGRPVAVRMRWTVSFRLR